MNISLESIARDLAFEIHLGGDRFDSDDLRGMLYGIPKDDLDTFRSRTLLHCRDFAPDEPGFVSFAERSVDLWLSGIITAEDLGRKVGKSWYEGVTLSDDAGKFFVFDDGRILECSQATVEACWGPGVRSRIVREMTGKDVALHYAGLLVEKYGDMEGGIPGCNLITYCMLPEGRVNSVSIRDGVVGFDVADGPAAGFYPVERAYDGNPALVVDLLMHELDDRIYADVRDAELRRVDLANFKNLANRLIDYAGKRVRSDLLYDDVLLESNSSGSVYVRREVNDLVDSDSRRLYVLTVPKNGRPHLATVSEDFDAGALGNLTSCVEKALMMFSYDESKVVGSSIAISDGPVLSVPGLSGPDGGSLKVERLVDAGEDGLMVCGMVTEGARHYPASISVSELSDKAVDVLHGATGVLLENAFRKQPQPEIRSSSGLADKKAFTQTV